MWTVPHFWASALESYSQCGVTQSNPFGSSLSVEQQETNSKSLFITIKQMFEMMVSTFKDDLKWQVQRGSS